MRKINLIIAVFIYVLLLLAAICCFIEATYYTNDQPYSDMHYSAPWTTLYILCAAFVYTVFLIKIIRNGEAE